jgi:hypothetical protein
MVASTGSLRFVDELGSRCRREGVQALTEGTPSLVAATPGWPPVRVKEGLRQCVSARAPNWPQSNRKDQPTAEEVEAEAAARSSEGRAVPLGHPEVARIDSTLGPHRLPRTRSG